MLAHEPLGVLEHDDGVVDDDADGNHHRKERQNVDAVTHHPKASARANERNGHRNHGNERRAPGAEEKKDDDGHQEGGLNERVAHLADGGTDEAGSVKGDAVLDVGRELLGQHIQPGADAVGGLQRVGTGLQEDADTGDWFAVEHAELLVTLRAKLDAGHVA